jgi:hypothetical protein
MDKERVEAKSLTSKNKTKKKLMVEEVQKYTVDSGYNEPSVPGDLVRYRMSSLYNIFIFIPNCSVYKINQ